MQRRIGPSVAAVLLALALLVSVSVEPFATPELVMSSPISADMVYTSPGAAFLTGSPQSQMTYVAVLADGTLQIGQGLGQPSWSGRAELVGSGSSESTYASCVADVGSLGLRLKSTAVLLI